MMTIVIKRDEKGMTFECNGQGDHQDMTFLMTDALANIIPLNLGNHQKTCREQGCKFEKLCHDLSLALAPYATPKNPTVVIDDKTPRA